MALLKVYLHGLFKSTISFKEVTVGPPGYEAADRADPNTKTYDYIYTFRKKWFKFSMMNIQCNNYIMKLC